MNSPKTKEKTKVCGVFEWIRKSLLSWPQGIWLSIWTTNSLGFSLHPRVLVPLCGTEPAWRSWEGLILFYFSLWLVLTWKFLEVPEVSPIISRAALQTTMIPVGSRGWARNENQNATSSNHFTCLQVLVIFTSRYRHLSLQHHSKIKFSKNTKTSGIFCQGSAVPNWKQWEAVKNHKEQGSLSSASVCQGQYYQLIPPWKPFPCLIPIGFLPTHFRSDWLPTPSPPPIQKQLSDPIPRKLALLTAQAVFVPTTVLTDFPYLTY